MLWRTDGSLVNYVASGCSQASLTIGAESENAWMQGFEGELRHWDVGFWAERLREAKYSISDEQLRPYFALPNVLSGLFQVPSFC